MRALFAKTDDTNMMRRLDARTKLAVTLTTAILAVACSGVVAQGVLFAATLFYVLLLKRPGLLAVLYGAMAVMMAIAAGCASVIEVFAPGLGGLSVKSLVIPFLRGLSMMNVVMVLAMTTRVEDLLTTLERMRLPFCLFLPAAVIGVLVAGLIKAYLFNAVTVAVALVVGGLLILWIENRQERLGIVPRVATMDDMTWKDALAVGFCQCLAMIPGTSRSGATIIGGLVLGLSRKAATEFSFFLSIPTIFGATVYDLWKSREVLHMANLPGLAIGTAVSFFSALLVVHWLLRYVSTNNFKAFGWYRILFGVVILVTAATGWVSWEGGEAF